MVRKGFSLPFLIIIGLIVLVVGFIAFNFYSSLSTNPIETIPNSISDSPWLAPSPSAIPFIVPNNWVTYYDWNSNRYSIKHPPDWSIHGEVINLNTQKSFEQNMKELPFKSYFENFVTINNKTIFIRDVIDAGYAYGHVIEANIPYADENYIWITAKKDGKDDPTNKYNQDEIDQFIQILNTFEVLK
ncbi:hypothetical protein A2165_00135 [Candidatus Curtissbacteria bacterium RBG_13_40_7]|uniref:Uncharacterized protein n=1 Tax=Candidatus Curtissbacteria bacterium RBG_13_40_7 TaxID=1797706 RepID=A0A1F5FXK0_9BACT|nr:MAG: hypothetical protein A2165_00135 [Candidatus Curtissbacteria bacterium RBG_13_40_7]